MKDLFLRKELKKPLGKELHKLVERVERLKNQLLELEQEVITENIALDEPIELAFEEPDITADEPDYIVLEGPKQKQSTITVSLEEEAIATVTKNKRQIIKQKIIGVTSKNRVTAKQLKEIIVDKHKYCSKATFYRYLGELKAENRVELIKINNKEYLYGIQREYRI